MAAIIITKIKEWLQPKLEETSLFLVDIKGSGNKIEIFIDGMENITIDQCASISRYLDEYLDKETGLEHQFNLEVSSPGMLSPLKVRQQFVKRIGQELDIVMLDGEKIIGKLLNINEDSIMVETREKIKKSKEEIIETSTINLDQIKKATVNFKF